MMGNDHSNTTLVAPDWAGGQVMGSIEAMAWALDLDKAAWGLTPTDRLVLVALANVAGLDGRPASVDYLTKVTGASDADVAVTLRRLAAKGLVPAGACDGIDGGGA